MAKHNYKITDEQFLETFYEQNGNYANTAKAIERKYGVPYTRQAVYERAKYFPEEVEQLWELREDHCEGALLTFADDEINDLRLRTRIYITIMKQLGSHRLHRNATPAKTLVQHYKAEPVDLSDKLLQMAERNKTLQETSIN